MNKHWRHCRGLTKIDCVELENAGYRKEKAMREAGLHYDLDRPLEHYKTVKAEKGMAKVELSVYEKELSSFGVLKMLAKHNWSSEEFVAKLNVIHDATYDERIKLRCVQIVQRVIEQAEGLNIHHQYSLENASWQELKEAEMEIIDVAGISVDEILERAEPKTLPSPDRSGEGDKGGEVTAG